MYLRIGTCSAASGRAYFAAIVAALAGLAPVTSHAQPAYSGEYEYYAAVGLKSQIEPYAVRNRLQLRGRYEHPGMMAYAAVRLSQALSDPEEGGDAGPFRSRLLEGFVDLYFDRIDVRIGHQLVVWGQMDGVFITDVVSPLDLTEFLAQDFTDIRLAVPAAKASYYAGPWSVTGLLVALPAKTLIPSRNSRWFVIPPVAASLDVLLGDDNLPEPAFDQIEPGLKIGFSGLETSLDLIYLYGRNRIPVLRKSFDLNAEDGPLVTLHPDYYRRHVLGTRLSTTVLDPLVLEAELAYEGRIEVDVDPSVLLANLEHGETGSGLLADQGHLLGGLAVSRVYGSTLVRGQMLGSLLTRYDDRSARGRFYGAVTMLLRTTWSNDTFVGSVFAYYHPGGDYWLNPMLQYNGAPGVNLYLGAHVFGGDSGEGSLATAAFGLFDANDFCFIRMTLAF